MGEAAPAVSQPPLPDGGWPQPRPGAFRLPVELVPRPRPQACASTSKRGNAHGAPRAAYRTREGMAEATGAWGGTRWEARSSRDTAEIQPRYSRDTAEI